ncbi:MAG TPA: zinc ABC transporter ATP-binding protein AztA [Acidimicrobiia bacterium]|nr:zinc ABC transporter ATP-binding protein AztA [Acidimicrobiia bacterium]
MPMNAVAAEDLVLRYGATTALAASSFTIPAGSITAVIGPNGSGKSTILSAIAGLLAPASGRLDVGLDSIAYVLQTTKVNDALPVTVREVVSMGRYATTGAYRWLSADDRRSVDDAIERMDLHDVAGRHLHELSGGQRQRVFVAQGLAQDHDLLLLDEPLTGLDLPSALAIDRVIHDEQAHGCTVVLTTHDLAEAQAADHVILVAGRVVAAGTPDTVLDITNLASAYGPALLHGEDERIYLDDPLLLEDPAHRPVPGRHLHRGRRSDEL